MVAALALTACDDDPTVAADRTEGASAEPLYAWLQHGARGLEVRAIVARDVSCPEVEVDGAHVAMATRAAYGPEFPVLSCSVAVPRSAARIRIDGQSLPTPTASPDRILVLGDTGCRMDIGWFENCDGSGTGAPWSLPAAARAAAAERPDLIVHVGDYVYREAPCDSAQQSGCAGSPWGDAWTTWEVDFFAPASPLLEVAPWILTRGNHEDCGRNHLGWLRFLDGRALTGSGLLDAGCPSFSAPYRVSFDDIDIVVIDTATDPESDGLDPTAQDRYAEVFTQAAALVSSGRPAISVTHRPFWALAPDWRDPMSLQVVDTTLQAAISSLPGQGWPAEMELALAGHIHLLETLSFDDSRPHQVVSGDAGTAQDSAITAAALAANADLFTELGMRPESFRSYHDFGYALIDRSPQGGWTVTVKNLEGRVLERIALP